MVDGVRCLLLYKSVFGVVHICVRVCLCVSVFRYIFFLFRVKDELNWPHLYGAPLGGLITGRVGC